MSTDHNLNPQAMLAATVDLDNFCMMASALPPGERAESAAALQLSAEMAIITPCSPPANVLAVFRRA
jgi:hypothetical protein